MYGKKLLASCNFISVHTPFGTITIFGNTAYILSVTWGRYKGGANTSLLLEAKAQLMAYFHKRLKSFDLPLNPKGTAFQKIVWKNISQIPFGQTSTYGTLSRAIQSSPRAIGGACKKNPIPIFIPCHRVVGRKQSLIGYSGGVGVKTKIQLLQLEDYPC